MVHLCHIDSEIFQIDQESSLFCGQELGCGNKKRKLYGPCRCTIGLGYIYIYI